METKNIFRFVHNEIGQAHKCGIGKVSWPSEEAARKMARLIHKARGGTLPTHFYPCKYCGGWHYSRCRDSNVFVLFGEFNASGKRITLHFNMKYAMVVTHTRTKTLIRVDHNRFPHPGSIIRRLLCYALKSTGREDLIPQALQWYWDTLGIPNPNK